MKILLAFFGGGMIGLTLGLNGVPPTLINVFLTCGGIILIVLAKEKL